jgi:hypothetical protein
MSEFPLYTASFESCTIVDLSQKLYETFDLILYSTDNLFLRIADNGIHNLNHKTVELDILRELC